MIKDVVEGLKLVTDSVESVRAIVKAVHDGIDYVHTEHPEIEDDLAKLGSELAKSLLVIKKASAVVTRFRFAMTTDNRSLELARFNDYFVRAQTDCEYLRQHLDELRTHCSKVREHASRITESSGVGGLRKIFSLLGLRSPKREAELGEQLDRLAYEDFQVANSALSVLRCLQTALQEIQDSLGDGGVMYPENIKKGADLLATYGPEFSKMEDRVEIAIREARDLVDLLEKR